MTKSLLIGLGSIGQRHAINLARLYPQAVIITADPQNGKADYDSWQQAVSENGDIDFAIIASPTDHHLTQMRALYDESIPFLCEKPPCREAETKEFSAFVKQASKTIRPMAFAFQYRFHPAADLIKSLQGPVLWVTRDDLLARYGRTVGGTMASHAIDFSLWAWGEAKVTAGRTNGLEWTATLQHKGVMQTQYKQRIDSGPRMSQVMGKDRIVSLTSDAQMYELELMAFIEWVTTGKRNPKTATLADGLRVMEVLSTVGNNP